MIRLALLASLLLSACEDALPLDPAPPTPDANGPADGGFGGFGGFGDWPALPPDAGARHGAGGFGGTGAWGPGGSGGMPGSGGFGGLPAPTPPDYGPDCNQQNGQACFCSETQPCPAGASCMNFQGGPGFCAQACTPHNFGQTCNLAAGATGTPECFWNLGNGGWGCSIRCASAPCPRGFHAVDTPGFWAGCACVR